MTRKEIIDGLKFTVDMCLFNATTGETYTEPRNDMDKITVDACLGAIDALNAIDELVRCKDCVYSKPWYKDKSLCYLWSETGIDVFNDGYCSYGGSEKKEGEV